MPTVGSVESHEKRWKAVEKSTEWVGGQLSAVWQAIKPTQVRSKPATGTWRMNSVIATAKRGAGQLDAGHEERESVY